MWYGAMGNWAMGYGAMRNGIKGKWARCNEEWSNVVWGKWEVYPLQGL